MKKGQQTSNSDWDERRAAGQERFNEQPANRTFLRYWEQRRTMGRTQYVLREAFFWLLPFTLIDKVIFPALGDGPYLELLAQEFAWPDILLNLAIVYLICLGIGILRWHIYEEKYNSLTGKV